MKGRYFGVYDLKNDEQCVGIFESVAEICRFFRINNLNRVHESVHRKRPLVFKKKRYWVVSYKEQTVKGARKLLRAKYGKSHYRIRENGEVYVRKDGIKGWRLLVEDFKELAG